MEERICDDSDSDNSEDGTPEEIQLFYDEWDKSQVLKFLLFLLVLLLLHDSKLILPRDVQGFEIDFSKLNFCFDWKALDLDDSTMVDEPETNRDFIAMLSNRALTKHNADNVRKHFFHESMTTMFEI